jgi:hypothetical protein
MNDIRVGVTARLLLTAALVVLVLSAAQAQTLTFSRNLSTVQKGCLAQLLQKSWTPRFHKEMMKIARVASSILNNKGRPDYIYLFEEIGWCGTAGCPLLIGELERDGDCRLLYSASADGLFVLRHRDHGYHRIYTPCEGRFDGREYQQLHEDCPNLDVRR